MSGYTAGERSEIDHGFQLISDELAQLHPSAEGDFTTAFDNLRIELRDPHLAKALVVAELRRGITKDEQPRISTSSLVMTPPVSAALKLAFDIGVMIAPSVLREPNGLLRKWFGKKPPQMSQAAKLAIYRVQMVHVSSQNRSKQANRMLRPPAEGERSKR